MKRYADIIGDAEFVQRAQNPTLLNTIAIRFCREGEVIASVPITCDLSSVPEELWPYVLAIYEKPVVIDLLPGTFSFRKWWQFWK